MRRATFSARSGFCRSRYFYPRSPCGERPLLLAVCMRAVEFLSTLSLRRATALARLWLVLMIFLSTLSLRRATSIMESYGSHILLISIHALLAESDGRTEAELCSCTDFYPRSPCGERLLSTAQGRRADNISIHALLAESDLLTVVP